MAMLKYLWFMMAVIPFYAVAVPEDWMREWPQTDFLRTSISLTDVVSGGPPKDGIPAIDDPEFMDVATLKNLSSNEPVIALHIQGDARAYPLQILMYHEIVNDVVGGIPVAVTYCPLCSAGIVMDRRVRGRVLNFGTTGKLRHSDMIMYDRQTESWWQQFLGEGLVGHYRGESLTFIPSDILSWDEFRQQFPNGKVLIPNDPTARPYGQNPYGGYDTTNWPIFFKGPYHDKTPALARVVVVGHEAWLLESIRRQQTFRANDLEFTWVPGQTSALDTPHIAHGRDIGTVRVIRLRPDGTREPVVYHTPFAFAFRAFFPQGILHESIEK